MYTITFRNPVRSDIDDVIDGISPMGSAVLRGDRNDLEGLLSRVALVEAILGRPVTGGAITWTSGPRVLVADLETVRRAAL